MIARSEAVKKMENEATVHVRWVRSKWKILESKIELGNELKLKIRENSREVKKGRKKTFDKIEKNQKMLPMMNQRLPHMPPHHGLGLLNQFMHHASPLDLMTAHHHDHPPTRTYNTQPSFVPSDPTENECKIVEYRGQKVAAFIIQGETMLCLPQAFDLFLKNLVGGLHTGYLSISICLVIVSKNVAFLLTPKIEDETKKKWRIFSNIRRKWWRQKRRIFTAPKDRSWLGFDFV